MKGWHPTTLGEICSLITDGKHGDCRNEENSGYYFISAKDIREGRINYEGSRQIVQADFAETHRRTDLRPGDLLITNSGTIGRMAIAADDERTARTTFQKSVAVLKPKTEEASSCFLYYYLNANLAGLIHPAAGAAQKNLLLGDIRRFQLKKPSLVEQERIVAAISPYDDLIENNRRRIALLEEAARMLYREWFVHFRFPGHEHVKIIDGLPEGWEQLTVGNVAQLAYGKALKEETRVEGPFPVYGSSGIVGTHQVALVSGPAIVVGRKGNVGSVYWSATDFWPIDTAYFIPREQADFWLYLALPNIGFQNTDGGVPGLNRDFAHSRKIIKPIDRLRRLINEAVEPMFAQRETLLNYNRKLAQARDLLLPRLMSGEIAV